LIQVVNYRAHAARFKDYVHKVYRNYGSVVERKFSAVLEVSRHPARIL